MKDPKRIKTVISKLYIAWLLNPDWRFGQLVSNLLGPGPQDVFNVSDKEWEKILTKYTKGKVQ